jgi:uncharacterized protein (TIGR03435 family)
MRLEREHCCDDVAVAACGNAFQYASALAEMEAIRGRSPEPALAATGGDLLVRIRRLLRPQERAPRSLGTMTAGALLIAGTMAMVSMYAAPQEQSPHARREFEVASVKLRKSPPGGNPFIVRFQALPGGRLVAENMPLRGLITTAYDIPPSRLLGAPGFGADVDRFDIEAKAPADWQLSAPANALADKLDPYFGSGFVPPMREMLQTLLETRFRLKYHWVTEQRRVYELTVNKGGPRMKHSAEGGCFRALPNLFEPSTGQGEMPPARCGFRPTDDPGHQLEAAGVTMTELAGYLSSTTPLLNVLDRTGLYGAFDVSLRWASSRGPGPVDPADPDFRGAAPPENIGPSIFTAVKEQLGLKLEEIKGPVRVMVVDSFERPSAN